MQGPFEIIGNAFDQATQSYVLSAVTNLIEMISPWVIAGVTITFMYHAYMIAIGKPTDAFAETLLKAAKVVAVVSIALSAGTYMTWIVGSIGGLQDGLASAIAVVPGSSSYTAAGSGAAGSAPTLYTTLDQNWVNAWEVIKKCFVQVANAGKDWNLGGVVYWLIAAVIAFAAAGVIVLLGGAMIFMAILMLKLVFAVGPLCIAGLLFQPTRRLFDTWFGLALSYVLKIALLAATMALAMTAFAKLVPTGGLGLISAASAIGVSIGLLVLALIFLRVLQEIPTMASALGGAAVASALTYAQARAAIGTAKAAGRAVGIGSKNSGGGGRPPSPPPPPLPGGGSGSGNSIEGGGVSAAKRGVQDAIRKAGQ